MLAPTPAEAKDRFRIDVPYTDSRTLFGKSYLLFTHPTSGYDSSKKAEQGVQALNQWAKSAGIPQILLFSGAYDSPHYYFSSADVDLTVASGAGQHQLSFPETETFTLAGGNFGLCFCESLRDSLKNANVNPLRVNLVTDAIYDNVVSAKGTAQGEAAKILAPLSDLESISLEEVRQKIPTSAFLEFARDRIVHDGFLCPWQGQRLELNDMELRLSVGGQEITVGQGQRKVMIEFVRTKDLTGAKNASTETPGAVNERTEKSAQ